MKPNVHNVKKVLVTGGAGYIGSVLVRRLLEEGYEVRVLDKFIFGNSSLKDIESKIEIIEKDIRNVTSSMLKGIDAIIHLAGFSTDPTSQYDPRLTDVINHIATENLAKLAKKAGIRRFAYASSCSVYFTLNTPLTPPLYKETDEVNPISSYSLTKRCSEQVLLAMKNNNFQPIIFRKGTLYGLSNRMRFDLVFNSFVKDAFFKRVLTVDAAGHIYRPLIDIQDACDAYIKALQLPIKKVGGKIFNVASENWNVGELAKQIKKIVKKTKKIDIHLDIRPYNLTRNYKVDMTLFKKTFSYKEARTMENSLLEIWTFLEKNKSLNPAHSKYYSDKWYMEYFKTKKGKKFKQYA